MKLYENKILLVSEEELKGILLLIGHSSSSEREKRGMTKETSDEIENFYFRHEDLIEDKI